MTSSRPTVDFDDGTVCRADRHGTSGAYVHHGCRCPDVLLRMSAMKRGYKRGETVRWRGADQADWVLLDRAMAGQLTPPLGRAERVEVVTRLASLGYNDAQIADRLWWWRDSPRGKNTVSAFRNRHNIPAANPRPRERAA